MRLGGRDFLLREMQQGRLLPSPRGLSILRVAAKDAFPACCTYLDGDRGCVLAPQQRSATCNYYLCDEAFGLAEREGDLVAASAREAHERITDLLGQCDLELSARVEACFPAGPVWDAAFLDWVAEEFHQSLQRRRKTLRLLRTR